MATITVPRPHVPFGPDNIPADKADADYLRSAVRNIDHAGRGERLWGSNLTATIRKLLLDAADALDPQSPESFPPRYSDPGRCVRCRHAEHDGFACLNMQSDNDCACPSSPDSETGEQ